MAEKLTPTRFRALPDETRQRISAWVILEHLDGEVIRDMQAVAPHQVQVTVYAFDSFGKPFLDRDTGMAAVKSFVHESAYPLPFPPEYLEG